ncbi:ATP-binding protein [Buchananella hordeovulneris]|uniref:ATP-binding protein n=1 Tax=Buchananella hordeovulneris TaxID=52770 RepID=UPI000F600319|nr:ATP-binding protein [Buchananella hordeovulneris]RRD49915.1 ATP-binding protein [Buchananella hordeovulneris]
MVSRVGSVVQGGAVLGAVIGGDFLGAGAGLFALLRDCLAGADVEKWQKALAGLARQGWDRAEELRTKAGSQWMQAERDACVAYFLQCLDRGVPPTVEGLRNHPGTGLADRRVPAAGARAAREYLSCMLQQVLTDRTYAIAAQVAQFAARSKADLERLRTRVSQLEAQLPQIRGLPSALELECHPGLRADEREVRESSAFFDFRSEQVPFVGRAEPLARLERFCLEGPANRWRWTAITGPGGTGKSRLAWELCARMREQGWQAFFLHRNALQHTDLRALVQAPAGYLIVIDYVSVDPPQVAKWLSGLPDKVNSPVRVVLLEREGWREEEIVGFMREPRWYSQLREHYGTVDLEQHRGLADLKLARDQISTADKIRLVEELGRLASPDGTPARPIDPCTAQELVARLEREIDPEGQRPLYLLFLVRAHLDNPDSDWRRWSAHDLRSVIYEREKQRLQQALPDWWGHALDLWVFATVTKSTLASIEQQVPEFLLCLIEGEKAKFKEDYGSTLKTIVGDESNQVIPYQPDIPGEHLVVSRVQEWLADGYESKVADLVAAAYKRDADGFADFLARALTDLDTQDKKVDLVLSTKYLLTLPPALSAAKALASALVVPVYTTTDAKRPQLLALLEEIYQQHPIPEIATALARSLGNLTTAQETVTERKKTASYIRILYQKHPIPDIATPLALALVNLTMGQETVTERKKTASYIRALYQKHPISEMAILLALALVNLTMAQETFAARAGIATLIRALYQKHPIPNIATCLARTLFNLTAGQKTVTNLEYTVAQIKALHEKHPTPEIATELAAALLNLTVRQRPYSTLLSGKKPPPSGLAPSTTSGPCTRNTPPPTSPPD